MKRKTKSIIAFLMTVVLLFGMLPADTFAQGENAENDEWVQEEEQNDGEVAELWSADGQTFIATYTTLQEAFTAAEAEDIYAIIKLLQDVTLTVDHTLNQDINLFLNGHTLTIQKDVTLTGTVHDPDKDQDRYPMIDVWSGFTNGAGGSIVNKGLFIALIDMYSKDISLSVEGGSVESVSLENGLMNVSGGTVYQITARGGVVNVSDGTVNYATGKEDSEINISGGTVEKLQSWGNVEISGGTVNSFEPENSISIIRGGIVKKLDMLNNMGSPTLLICGDAEITEDLLLEFYGGTEDCGVADVLIFGSPRIAKIRYDAGHIGEGADTGEGNWGNVTISGGYFANDPSENFEGMVGYPHIIATIGDVEEYSNQEDWAVSSEDYKWRIKPAAEATPFPHRTSKNEGDEAKVDFYNNINLGYENKEIIYKTGYFSTIEEALEATEIIEYGNDEPSFNMNYHPKVTLLKDVIIDKVIDVTNNSSGRVFMEMGGHNMDITKDGGITGTVILTFDGIQTGMLTSCGTIGVHEFVVYKGLDAEITGGTISSSVFMVDSGEYTISGGEFTGVVEISNWGDLDFTITGNAKFKEIDYQVNKSNPYSISLNLAGGYYTVDPETLKTYTVNGTVRDQSGYVNYDETKVEEYNGQADWEADPETYTWRIKREVTASSFSTVPAAVAGLKENGSALALVTAGVAVGGTVMYALGKDATTAPTTGWSNNLPTATAAGTYYVWYKIDPDADHLETQPACITVTVAAKENNNQNNDPNNDPNNNQNNNDENNESNNENNNNNEEQNTPTPPPVDNSEDSPFQPVPEITATTESLYLVKGQTFSLNEADWTSSNKKVVSVSKKTGAVKAIKATGNTPVELTRGTDATKKTLKIYVADPKVKTKKLSVGAGKTVNAEITTDFKDKLPVYWYSSATDIAIVDQTGKVSGLTKGKADITAQINGKAFTFKVTVTEETVVAERTLHMTKGASMTVKKLGKVNITALSSTSSNVLVEKKKITAKECGTAIVEATGGDGKTYKLNMVIEDPTITNLTAGKTNKYSVELTAGKSHEALKFKAFDREVVFKSNKPKVAYINEKGEIIALSKGKAKLTGKINGKTITINVKVNAQ